MSNSSGDHSLTSGLSPVLVALRTCFVAFLTLLIITGNVLSIAVTHRISNLADSTKVLMITLAVYDISIGLVVPLDVVASALDRWPFGHPACTIIAVATFIFFVMQGVSILFLNMDRCTAITWPYRFPTWCSRRRIIVAVVMASALILALAITTQFLGVSANYLPTAAACLYETKSKTVNTLALLFLDVIPTGLMTGIYYQVIKISRRHELRINNRNGQNNVQNNNALKTSLIVTLTFAGCYTPFLLSRAVEAYAGVTSPPWLEFATVWLSTSNSIFNVFIYYLFNRAYRRTAKKIISERLPACKRSVLPLNI